MALKVAKTVIEARSFVLDARLNGKAISLVPTMGALHEGHLSLVDIAKEQSDFVVVSIFVNPTQFGPNEDFETYPRFFERDRALLEEQNVDLIFAPDASEIYRDESFISFRIDKLADHLCGAHRPGHFEGVIQIVSKLFHIVRPEITVFGQKDLQQLVIIKRLVDELDFPIRLIAGPTIREPDGLAMSSRNSGLSTEAREGSAVLFKALQSASSRIAGGEKNSTAVIEEMKEVIGSIESTEIQYIEIVNLEKLQPITELEGKFAIALAVHFGETRLIDNMVLEVNGDDVQEIKALY